MKSIQSHTNTNNETYFSTTDKDGQMIYSFSEDFEDFWTQDDHDAAESNSTPAKY